MSGTGTSISGSFRGLGVSSGSEGGGSGSSDTAYRRDVRAFAAEFSQIGGSSWTAAASRKMPRLVELAETFRLPVVHFVDVGGFTIGSQAEKAGTIRDGTRAIATLYQSTVPWCAVILRRAFGVAGAGMIDHTRFRYRIAWPSGDWGSLPVEQVTPARPPDLFAARPVVVLGRYRAPGQGDVTLRGMRAGRPFSRAVRVTLPDARPANEAVAHLWAHHTIEDLTARDWQGAQRGHMCLHSCSASDAWHH